MTSLILRRSAVGILTVWLVSVVIFGATQALPGNAAYAILGNTATPAQVQTLEARLHLDRPALSQYGSWISGVLGGDPGNSLVSGRSVWADVGPRLTNSAVLAGLAAVVGTLVGVSLGVLAARRKDSAFDDLTSIGALVVTSLPEFVVGVTFVILFATGIFKVLPAVSLLPPGTSAWQAPDRLVLPVLTLAVVIAPYIFRMTRAAMIEALESDYVEMARLKGLSNRRVLIAHALPNAIPPIVQVIGLCILYLAGGVVVVEYVFAFPGIGQGLVQAVSNRDVPSIQLIVLMLAAFYVFVNIITDVIALAATPRRRLPR